MKTKPTIDDNLEDIIVLYTILWLYPWSHMVLSSMYVHVAL